jgi:hypothetical protein
MGRVAVKEGRRLMSDAAERMRRMRERKRAAADPILYERADWRLFTDRSTLPQKAGCGPSQIGRVILKELVDNALDAGAGNVTLVGGDDWCSVADDGPGLDADRMVQVFAVNRPLLSSKLKRLPTRGMLGNGLRVVMGAAEAYRASIAVTTRGVRYELAVNSVTGHTTIVEQADKSVTGLTVELRFPHPIFNDLDFEAAQTAIRLANVGEIYNGPSLPNWYSFEDLQKTIADASGGATAADVRTDLFGTTMDKQPQPSMGFLGEAAFGGYYHRIEGVAHIRGAEIPYTVEAWCGCSAIKREESPSDWTDVYINRSLAITPLWTTSDSTGLRLYGGCGIDVKVNGPKRARYDLDISVITPYLRLMNDGKSPYLRDFVVAIEQAVKKAAGQSYRYMDKPPGSMSFVDAAALVMKTAYMKASDNGRLPANARQIMYAARPEILRLTGAKKLDDNYFTQTLLPNYIADHPAETKDWDVVYDARGHFIEPHTSVNIALGTLQVRQYVGERPIFGPIVQVSNGVLYPTSGASNRYSNVLFIEKEGFAELFAAVQLAERYDLAILSTKGMSNTAARLLLDRISPDIENVFVLHDFDISGFSILGTLATDSERYIFKNNVPIVDLGLRLEDVEDLESEPTDVNIEAHRDTLEEHGATEEEIAFLANQRVELNAMTARELVDFVEEKLEEHGVTKLIPEAAVIEKHARRLLERAMTETLLVVHLDQLARQAAEAALPDSLIDLVRDKLNDEPQLSWDEAVADIIQSQ